MISMDKTYRTRDGHEVRIYAVDGGGGVPVHGAVKGPTGWVSCCWQRDGVQMFYEDTHDLIEVKPRIKRTVWLNVYRRNHFTMGAAYHFSKEKADMVAYKSRLACVKVEIDCEEGEGL